MRTPTPASRVLPTSAAVPQRTILGDETIALGSIVLVASRSKPGTWYPVFDAHCPCEGFGYRHTCRHLERARLALDGDEPSTQPDALPTCSRCHRRPINPKYSPRLCTGCFGYPDPE